MLIDTCTVSTPPPPPCAGGCWLNIMPASYSSISTFTVSASVGAVVHWNVSESAPCALQYTPAAAHAAMLAGAGATMTLLSAVTPDTLTVCALLLHPLVGRVAVAVDMDTPPELDALNVAI